MERVLRELQIVLDGENKDLSKLAASILAISTRNSEAGSINEDVRFIYAKEAITVDGEAHYHPLVGGLAPTANKADYVMDSYDNIVDLQDSATGYIAKMAERCGVIMKIIAVPVSEFKELEEALAELIDRVFDLVDQAIDPICEAKTLLGVPSEATLAKVKILTDLFANATIAGAAVDKNGKQVSVEDVEYVTPECDCDDEYEDEDEYEDFYDDDDECEYCGYDSVDCDCEFDEDDSCCNTNCRCND